MGQILAIRHFFRSNPLRLKIVEITKTICLWAGILLFSLILGHSFLKNDVLFIGIIMFLSVVASINWPFFSIVLLVLLAIVQPGLLNETIEMFRPFFLISGATFLSWFLGFTTRHLKKWIRMPQAYCVLGLWFAETFGTLHIAWLDYTVETFMLWLKINIIFFLVAVLSISEKKVRFIMWATVWGAAFVALFALDIYFHHPEKMLEGRLGSYGMYENANDLALIMVVTWPLIFKLIEIECSLLTATILTLILGLNTVVLLLTISRGGLIGLMTVGFLCLWTCSKLTKKQRLFIVGIALLVAIIAMPILLAQRGEESGFDAEDESASHRILAWEAGGRILLAYPTGIGYNCFMDFGSGFGAPGNLQPHNTPVKIAAEGGFIGITCYIIMIFLTLYQLLKLEFVFKEKKSVLLVGITQALRIALIGFLVNTSFSQKEVEWVFYIILGLSCAVWNFSQTILHPEAGGEKI